MASSRPSPAAAPGTAPDWAPTGGGIERTFAWLHGFRRLRIRWERRADIHEAFLKLARCLITHRQMLFSTRPAASHPGRLGK